MVSGRRSTRVRRGAIALLASPLLLLSLTGVAHAAPPANDAFADAIPVTEPLPFTDTQDTTDASLEADEPQLGDVNCGFDVGNTVWYSYTPSATAVVAADTIGSDFDTVLGVWEGASLNALTLVGCVDDTRGLQSVVPFRAESGVDYHIQIGGFAGDSGTLAFRVRETTAGFVEGTVTDEDTTAPLGNVCAVVIDAVFGSGNVSLTRADGTYSVAARPGEYIVFFFDCFSEAYVPEFWNDVAEESAATEVVVAADAVVTGIDAALTPACPGFGSSGLNQVVGTSASETLVGTASRDVLCGFGGDDVLRGASARDWLFGGRGADLLAGNDGSDSLFGSAGRDTLLGGDGRDFLDGGPGRDSCNGGPDRDRARACEVTRRI